MPHFYTVHLSTAILALRTIQFPSRGPKNGSTYDQGTHGRDGTKVRHKIRRVVSRLPAPPFSLQTLLPREYNGYHLHSLLTTTVNERIRARGGGGGKLFQTRPDRCVASLRRLDRKKKKKQSTLSLSRQSSTNGEAAEAEAISALSSWDPTRDNF